MSPHAVICRVVHIVKRENAIVNRLNKTKVESVVDHEAERIERVKRENAVKRATAAAKVHLPPRYKDAFTQIKLLKLAEKGRPRTCRGTQGQESRTFIQFLSQCESRG